MQKPNIDKVKKALAAFGIHDERELDEAIKNMKPLNIGCMVSPVNRTVIAGDSKAAMSSSRI